MKDLSIGVIALVIFLLLTGLAAITNFRFVWMGTITGIAAIVAAIFLVLRK